MFEQIPVNTTSWNGLSLPLKVKIQVIQHITKGVFKNTLVDAILVGWNPEKNDPKPFIVKCEDGLIHTVEKVYPYIDSMTKGCDCPECMEVRNDILNDVNSLYPKKITRKKLSEMSWDDAPSWALYRAVNFKGEAFYFQNHPSKFFTDWNLNLNIGCYQPIEGTFYAENWQDSIEKHPRFDDIIFLKKWKGKKITYDGCRCKYAIPQNISKDNWMINGIDDSGVGVLLYTHKVDWKLYKEPTLEPLNFNNIRAIRKPDWSEGVEHRIFAVEKIYLHVGNNRKIKFTTLIKEGWEGITFDGKKVNFSKFFGV